MRSAGLDADRTGRAPPVAGFVDVLRLGGAMLGELARHRGKASMRRAVRGWSERTSVRLGNADFVLKVGSKRLLLVGGLELSRCVLAPRPGTDGLVAGNIKQKAMATLAPKALTISDGDDWTRRRAFNEFVLDSGHLHSLAPMIAAAARTAFREPITNVESIRDAMRRTMLAVDFGEGVAPDHIAADLEYLSGLVQNPLRRMLLGPFAGGRRRRLRSAIATMWASAESGPASLLKRAREAPPLGDDEVLEQVPHWMFTFLGSATDLLAHALWLALSHEPTRTALVAEIASAGESLSSLDGLPLLNGCLLEAAQLYPTTNRTFHHTTQAVTLGATVVPANVEIVHWFPLLQPAQPVAPSFRPRRWADGHTTSDEPFDPFLGGSRACPGKHLILFVCKVAMAELLVSRPVALACAALDVYALPMELPAGLPRFAPRTPHQVPT